MQLSEIIHFLDNEFHPEYQENYDNSGFLLGNPDTEYTGALVAIDPSSSAASSVSPRPTPQDA